MAVLDNKEKKINATIDYLRDSVRNGYRFYTKDSNDKNAELKRLDFDPADLYSSSAPQLAKSFANLQSLGRDIYIVKRDNTIKKVILDAKQR